MFKIPKIEKESFYIDLAMKAMQENATKERQHIEDRFEKNKERNPKKVKEIPVHEIKINKRKDLELIKIRYLNQNLNMQLKKIISRFPKFAKVDPIYKRLIDTTDYKVSKITDSLQRLLWIANTIDEFTQSTEHKIKRAKTQETVGFLMKKYLGRVNSLFSKNKEYFRTLDQARMFMNKLPTFLDIYTVVIAGFPNVGKSTLMNKMSGSEIEIQNYPFTTKGLMFGYLKKNEIKIVQMIDTPGLLGREKTNPIEERARIVITESSDFIIFVLDFTESCGYNIESQIKLLKKTQETKKEIVLYLSKTDLFDEEVEEIKQEHAKTLKKFTVFESSEKVKDYILNKQTSSQKFDINNIKIIK